MWGLNEHTQTQKYTYIKWRNIYFLRVDWIQTVVCQIDDSIELLRIDSVAKYIGKKC